MTAESDFCWGILAAEGQAKAARLAGGSGCKRDWTLEAALAADGGVDRYERMYEGSLTFV